MSTSLIRRMGFFAASISISLVDRHLVAAKFKVPAAFIENAAETNSA